MGVFGSIFSSKSKQADASFVNPITTELHSHLLPAIDDGVQTIEESIDVLYEMSRMGYKKVITTPHIMGDFYKNGPHNIPALRDKVQEELHKKNIPIELHAAAEYMVDDAFEDKIKRNEILSFGKEKYVLIELPFTNMPPNFKNVLFELQINGYKPVLAHPERYGLMARQKEKYEELFEAGILFQINLFSLVGYYSKQVQKTSEWLLDKKMVNMVGSDMHSVRHLDVLHAATRSLNYQKLCGLPLVNNLLLD